MNGAAASEKDTTDVTLSSANDKTASVDEADDCCHSNHDTQDYSALDDDDDTGDLC